jgi:hypothetical protein
LPLIALVIRLRPFCISIELNIRTEYKLLTLHISWWGLQFQCEW